MDPKCTAGASCSSALLAAAPGLLSPLLRSKAERHSPALPAEVPSCLCQALRWQASKRRAEPASRSQPVRCPPAVKGWTEAPRQSSQTCCPLCHLLAGLSFLSSVCSSAQWRESLQPQNQCLSLLVGPRIETKQVHGLWVSPICRDAPQGCTMPLGRAGLRGSPKSLAWALASQAPRIIFNYSSSIRAHLEKRENTPRTDPVP